MLFGSLAFLSLIALCFVLARSLGSYGQKIMAMGLTAAGAIFAAALVESMVGGPFGSLVLFVGASLALITVSASSAKLLRPQTQSPSITSEEHV
jgi:hypothetical protein